MAKITIEEIKERMNRNSEDTLIYRQWGKVNEKFIEFERKADFNAFKYIFEDDAERLWNHFRVDCDRKFQQFLTYLTREQRNELLVNVYENQEIYYAGRI